MDPRVRAIAHLGTAISSEVSRQVSKGRVMSTLDIGTFLDHELEHYEARNGDCLSEKEFGEFIDEICEDLVAARMAYTAGDAESYIKNVRSGGLISMREHHMRKSILNTTHRTVFRDTEFPYDPATGMYILDQGPKLNLPQADI
jgi:hypothetical protein